MRVDKSKWNNALIKDSIKTLRVKDAIQKKDYLLTGKYPIISQEKDFISGYCNTKDNLNENFGEVVIFGDHTRIVKYVDFDFCIGADGVKVLRPINKLSSKYLYYFIKWSNIPSNGYSRHFKFLRDIRIQYPEDKSIQQKIAAELDSVQEMIDGYKAQLADLDALAQSTALDTFGVPVSNSKGWGKKTLNDVCSKITDGTHDTPKRLTEGIKFITGKHIRPFFIDYDHSDYVSENVHKEIYARCNPQKGDVLYTNIGSGVGTAAVNTVDYEFSMKNVALLKPSKVLNGIYLQFVLNDIHFKSVVLPTYLAGGAQSFLSLKQIKSMLIPLPNFVHQQQFAERVEAIEKQKDLLREQLKDAETLMAERMQYYFS